MLIGAIVGAAVAVALAVPLAWKWELGIARVTAGVALLAIPAVGLVAVLDAWIGVGSIPAAVLSAGLTLSFAFAVLAWRFYRDPDRNPPSEPGAIVSPADGEVVYVKASRGGSLPTAVKGGRQHRLDELTGTEMAFGDAQVVGIAMSFLDVHINRAPIEGKVTLRKHVPGLFGSLRDPEMLFANERATTVIEGDGYQVAVVQIASRLVRQIASFVSEGENVAAGQRIGVIRLGSQVDVVLPDQAHLSVCVRPGERVRAGETVIARIDGA